MVLDKCQHSVRAPLEDSNEGKGSRETAVRMTSPRSAARAGAAPSGSTTPAKSSPSPPPPNQSQSSARRLQDTPQFLLRLLTDF